MKEKPKKSRSLKIFHGQVKEIHFSIGLKQQPIKSLGRWYSIPLTDRHRGTEIEETARKGLTAIDEIDFPAGKRKDWIFQHRLLLRLLWPLHIHKVTLTRVEAIQRLVKKLALEICKASLPVFHLLGCTAAQQMSGCQFPQSLTNSRLERCVLTNYSGTRPIR